jgi:DNA-binding response OmpR family regulator
MNILKSDFLVSSAGKGGKGESIQLRFAEEMRDVTIGVIDDDIVIQELIKTAFSDTNWQVLAYENGRKFVDDLENETFDLIFLDLLMPVLDGFGVLAYLKEKKVEMPVIVLSAVKERDTVVRAIRSGARSYLTKPISPGGILKKTTEILKRNF